MTDVAGADPMPSTAGADEPDRAPTTGSEAAAAGGPERDVASTDDADIGSTPDAGTPDAEAPATDAEAPATDAPAPEAGPYAKFVLVEVVSVNFDLPNPSPTIHLREDGAPYRGIDFPIGLPEAQSIAMALEHERGPRPSTHDLLAATLVAAAVDVIAVRLTGAKGGTILAELDLMTTRGHEVLDCRPTDGIAVALRLPVPAPILADEDLLE